LTRHSSFMVARWDKNKNKTSLFEVTRHFRMT
jgi:hypothetical protein